MGSRCKAGNLPGGSGSRDVSCGAWVVLRPHLRSASRTRLPPAFRRGARRCKQPGVGGQAVRFNCQCELRLRRLSARMCAVIPGGQASSAGVSFFGEVSLDSDFSAFLELEACPEGDRWSVA